MGFDTAGRIRVRLPQLAAVLGRFPLAAIAAAALAVYLLFDLNRVDADSANADWRKVKIPVGLAAAFLWSVGATLWAEARGSDNLSTALSIAGWCVLAMMLALSNAIDLTVPLLAIGLLVGLSMAAYIGRGSAEQNATFWLFNHDLWTGAAASIVAVALFAGGISAIVATLDYLFGLKFPFRVHEKIWIIATTIIGPIYWLSLAPRTFDTPVADGSQGAQLDLVSRAIGVLGRFVAVPLLLVYCAILHVYGAKILIESSLPKGRLGWMVLSFGAAMALTLLLIYPTRGAGGRHVRFFWRFWPYLLIVPVALLFLAVGARVRQYGVTEERYLVALAGVWLALLALIYGLQRSDMRDLRLIPALLAGLLLLASFGPWGMTGWSINNQVSEFSARLAAAGLVKDGRIVPGGRPTTTLLPSDRQRLQGIVSYLHSRGRLGDLRSIFAGDTENPFTGAPVPRNRYDTTLADRISTRLALRAGGQQPTQTYSYSSANASVFAIGNGARLVGPLDLSIPAGSRKAEHTITTPAGSIALDFQKPTLSVTDVSGRAARFNLARLLSAEGALITQPPAHQPRPPLEVPAEAGPVKARLIIIAATARKHESDDADLTYMRFWVVLDPGL